MSGPYRPGPVERVLGHAEGLIRAGFWSPDGQGPHGVVCALQAIGETERRLGYAVGEFPEADYLLAGVVQGSVICFNGLPGQTPAGVADAFHRARLLAAERGL